ncbi:hypothetical protein [Salinactinospora qingdaonensis]|uniref:C2H2-type domain-containing protein n=1 Tax=Salinactinospora qingdaonensis TaxID=702744 RepID=A0ABP7FTV5_9ACTN
MSGLRIVCDHTTSTDTDEGSYIFEPESLTSAQALGDACAICHAKWPRPRRPLGALPDGTGIYGCGECAGIVADHQAGSSRHALAAH